MEIKKTTYKDINAIACITEKFIALFLPEYGAKLTSLKSCTTGREFMEQSKEDIYIKPSYGGVYTDAECSAFDDMFPTIDAFYSNEYPWKGIEYPDHGEVYALKWDYEIAENALHMWVYSVRFGYRLDKWVTEKNGAIVVKYRVKNLTDFAFPYIYAAHCMIAAEEGVRLELPYEGTENITTIFSTSGKLGKYGVKCTWPVFEGKDYSLYSLEGERESYKFFFDNPIPQGKCICRYPEGYGLEFGFDHQAMPYFAVWGDTGACKGRHTIALEPCTGAFDRPDIAKLHQKDSVLAGKETKEWSLYFDYLGTEDNR